MTPYSAQVQNRIAAVSAAALLVAGLAACSSEKQPNHPSQASVTVNGNTVANQKPVTCNQQVFAPATPADSPSQEQWYWTLTIGDQKVSGVKALVSKSDDKFIAQSVHIVNLGGFTGTYAMGDGEDGSASFSSETFTISGTAKGFNTYTPTESATATFKIVATC